MGRDTAAARRIAPAAGMGAAAAAAVAASAGWHLRARHSHCAANVQALFFLASIFASVGLLKANLATGLVGVGHHHHWQRLLSQPARLADAEAGSTPLLRSLPAKLEVGIGALFVLFGARLVLHELAGWL